ncbi:MAG: Histidine kinase [Humibacillus sp.]|nr:Histidine kinase [Humibacillus sp.]
MTSPAALTAPERNPWERHAWLIQAVWLVFLVFPVLSIVTETTGVARVVGLVLVLAFGVVYLLGCRHLNDQPGRPAPATRWVGSIAYLVVLCAIVAVTAPLTGAGGSLSFFPFVVSYAMFALPVAAGAGVGVVASALAVAVAVWSDPGEGTWVVVFILLSVTLMTGLIRFMTDRGEAYRHVAGELALVNERERVARDVHDVLGHSLTVITVKAELAERLLDLDPQRARSELVEVQALSRQALAEIRATVGGLRAARLDDELVSARTALAGAGIEAHLPDDPAGVDPRHRMVLAWVLREAVTNVVRHSDADACAVELATNRLRVSDDGRGLGGRPEGNGIRGLRERVEAAGGSLALTTGPAGHGTVLEVTL